MHVHSSLILLMGLFYAFAPLFTFFMEDGRGFPWFFPHALWALVILVVVFARTEAPGDDR